MINTFMNAGKNTFCFFLKILPSRQSPRESFFAERKERFQILFLKALFRVKRPFTPSSFCTKGSTPFHISSVSLLKLLRYKPGCFVFLRKHYIIYSYHIATPPTSSLLAPPIAWRNWHNRATPEPPCHSGYPDRSPGSFRLCLPPLTREHFRLPFPVRNR